MKSMVSTKKPLSIEGIPLITRFKTNMDIGVQSFMIEEY